MDSASVLNNILQSIIATYFFLIIIKITALVKLKKFIGDYTHVSSSSSAPTNILFTVSLKWKIDFLNPIQGISINIKRKGDIGDWNAELSSDILNIHHFEGTYTVKNKPDGGLDGWFDVYLFKKPNIRMALHLHYLIGNRWKEDEGYYIEKK